MNQKTIPDRLHAAAKTFESRNAIYRDNYKTFGLVMQSLFPEGLTVKSAEEWNRLCLLIAMTGKMTRYTVNFSSGGHVDSIHDMTVYAAMLEELTEQELSLFDEALMAGPARASS